ncbi:multidrug resistance-associated protein 1 isoform X4 [Dendroctonus ponderosae]|uniref:multidrug resistance-associated protein 1 isoform X4 n=1 Tax=Dendroctonus ponderosae TaxID=77166 RepID=UPI002035F21F|nr:multidrug resistance-associated protein 1 isoform X4 [Dendroctonus ponderosae]
MDQFCGSEFWNTSLTWQTDDPDFTICFEKTVLVWVPCLFLCLFTGLEIFYITNSTRRDIPWNLLNSSKVFVTAALCILMISDFITSLHKSSSQFVPSVDICQPVVKFACFLLTGLLVYYNKKYGIRTSGLLFLFWFLLSLFGAAQFRTEIRTVQREGAPRSYYQYVSYLIFYPLVLLMFLLNCFADQPPRVTKYPKKQNECPEDGAGFLSRMLFSWFDTLTWKGFKNPLEMKDLWDLNPADSAAEIVPIFEKHWQNTLSKSKGVPTQVRAQLKGSGEVDFLPASKKEASVLPALLKSFGPMFLFGAMLKLMQDILMFVSPQLLGFIINFVKNGGYAWHGPFFAVLMFLTATIQTLFLAQYFNRMFIVGMRIRTALVSTIYRKSLNISNNARKERTAGEIVNLMSVDAQKFMDLTTYLNMIWSAPLQICLSMYFLWQELGPSVLAGLAVMIILIPINGFIADKSKNLQIKQMKNKDERVKLMNEVLSGMKVLKLYAWEPSFEAHVLKIRDKEVKVLKEAAYLNAGTSFIWSCAPFLVSLVTFATYVLVDERNILDANKAYVSISLFNILRFPLSMLPMMISNMVQTYVSVKRINTFMNAEELDPNNVSHDETEADPLVIENGSFSWGEDSILKGINIRIPHKTLTAIVGSVGAGKSSLISAFLGEMDKVSGRVNTYGTVAYVSQQAWIQNATLKDNILFGKSYDKDLYDKVIEGCALKPDFDMLPGGDQTEIGEKGINLSGGQKQRVSLARAVYADAEIYYLDDPLSAVDSHVGKHIFDQVLGPTGLLKNKTRVLVTHGIIYLPQTDKIFVVTQGEISESGSYQELLAKKGAFAEFLLQHIQEHDEDAEELDEIKKQIAQQVSDDLSKQLVRKRSKISESKSDSGSNPALNGSLQRQKSQDSNKAKMKESEGVNGPVQGEKLIEVEKSETGSVSWQVYKHYIMSIGVVIVIITVFLNMLFQGFSIGSNVWLGIWADDTKMVDSNGTVDTARRDLYLGVYGALGVGQFIVMFFATLVLYIGTLNAAKKLHVLLLSNIIRAPCSIFFDVTPVGRILNRFSKDVDTLDTVLPLTLRAWITCLFSVLGTLAVTSYTTPPFTIIIAPIGILYYFIQRFYVATSRQLKRLESVSRSPIYSHFGETVSGVQAIRAYGQQARFTKESEYKVDQNQLCYYPSIISNRWLAVRLEMIGNLIILFAALFAVLAKNQMPGLVGLSITYCLQITQTLNWLVRMTSDVETNIVAVERIKEYAEVPQEAPWKLSHEIMPSSWPETGAVTFKDYSVRYRPGLDLVLHGVNFTVNGSEKVGIVGRTGAGKSSLTLSLFRIIEAAEGQIIIDGVNVALLGLHTLRSRLTIIPQDAVLFSGSLRMNLDPFDKHSDDEVWKSLELAHLKTFVQGLSSGLNHEISEGGDNLSVGQRQLVCLARALLRKTKVLILDEATAAVDLETDDLIQRTIRTEFKDCTVLTIAHRLNTIMDSDRVIVLDKGKVVEFDSPANLLKRPESIFYGMCKDAGLA